VSGPARMAGLRIIGSGRHLPGRPYSNDELSRVMDTNDAWIRQRTGITTRHFARPGQGPADLALPAARQALESAGLGPEDLDYVLFNTMTPDHVFPGSAPLLSEKLGCRTIPALDLRTQCAAMLYAFQVADALLGSGAANKILIVGAEAHAAVMPWLDWEILEGTTDRRPTAAAWERATKHRGWGIIFGDGAGALIVERAEGPGRGVLAVDLQADGRYAPLLCIPAGFREHPYVSAEALERDATLIHMDGREVFKHAVTKLPKSVQALVAKAGVKLSDIDWFVAHQANQRINEAVCQRLGVPLEKMPGNIDRYGNTSGATIPILLDEMRRDGRLKDGQLVCLLALGAGFHWGSLLFRA
jgi:3-oxoacyl-[acyl-carrier-protein] synthase-3